MDSSGKIGIAVIGFGYWGPNVVRNFSAIDGATVAYVCDLNDERLRKAKRLFPFLRTTSKVEEVLSDRSIDLIAIATPVSSHYPLAMLALAAGKHVFVEKPLASSSQLAGEIVSFAAKRELKVFVDHTFIFTPAVRKVREVFARGDLGRPLYYDSVRINLGIFQHDVNVVWDLVTHDLAILDYVLDGQLPQTVSCTGVAHFGNDLADLAYVTLKYRDDFIAHIHVNWLAPVKIRQVLLCGDKRMLIYDDNSAAEKIRVYDSGVEVSRAEDLYRVLVQYRTGDMHSPRLDNAEALELEAENVIDSLRGLATPFSGGDMGLRVVTILEAADESLKAGGQPVALENPDELVRAR
jgi:predicted dehydrogenase